SYRALRSKSSGVLQSDWLLPKKQIKRSRSSDLNSSLRNKSTGQHQERAGASTTHQSVTSACPNNAL
ncbi:hypothetical protein, partial [Pseudomonas parafulva]|uniref:hypothetical protein n=1 Tax=Pseudomonas parafulva TaxID=157782 RepID=UPI001C3F268B